VGLLGFSASAWKTRPRDERIGWSREQRRRNLGALINNPRFLTLPWIRIGSPASTVLARAARVLPGHWAQRYGYRPVLLETFVDSAPFAGTCYRAANRICVGEAQGRGKRGDHRLGQVPVKTVRVYPFARDSRTQLCR
jgi:hypothetical protein